MVVLEELSNALKRNAPIIAELVGYGLSADAYHVSSPSKSGDGAIRAMNTALHDARLGAESVDYVNAHATSTPMGDDIEAEAIKNVFSVPNSSITNAGPLVSSTKGATGHMLGAAGAMEAAISALAVRDNAIPPTLGLRSPSGATLNHVTEENFQDQRNRRELTCSMSNSFGFGGTNSCIIFKKIGTGDGSL